MQGCSNDDFLKPSLEDKLNFPLHIEKFGKAVANEIHQTVINLNERGVDYSNAKNTPEFKKQFYEEKFIYTIIMRIVICLYGM